jgi:hypothetical protein
MLTKEKIIRQMLNSRINFPGIGMADAPYADQKRNRDALNARAITALISMPDRLFASVHDEDPTPGQAIQFRGIGKGLGTSPSDEGAPGWDEAIRAADPGRRADERARTAGLNDVPPGFDIGARADARWAEAISQARKN